jgi:hypothetical protein
MKNNFIPYEIALELKNLNFNEPCFAYYKTSNKLKKGYRLRYVEHEDTNPTKQPLLNNDCLAPLYQQVFEFFRNKYNLFSNIFQLTYYDKKYNSRNNKFACEITEIKNSNTVLYANDVLKCTNKSYKTYREAELECIKHLIKIVQNEQ